MLPKSWQGEDRRLKAVKAKSKQLGQAILPLPERAHTAFALSKSPRILDSVVFFFSNASSWFAHKEAAIAKIRDKEAGKTGQRAGLRWN